MFIIACSLTYNLISNLLANSQTDEDLDKIKAVLQRNGRENNEYGS